MFVPDREGLVKSDHETAQDGFVLASSLRCHPGRVREENQDRVARVQIPLGELYLVADGVGGQNGGGKAASCAIAEYSRFMLAAPSTADPVTALQQATVSVTDRIQELRDAGPAEFGAMASTVVLVLIHGWTAYVGHLGDSRAYLGRRGVLTALTRDHSVVAELVERGILAEENAESHPSAHILTRSLGDPSAALAVTTHRLENDDTLLLCSDGLWAYLAKASMASCVTDLLPVSEAANALMDGALEGGGRDNIGLVLLRLTKANRDEMLSATASEVVRKRLNPQRLALYLLLGIALLATIAALLACRVRIVNPKPSHAKCSAPGKSASAGCA